MLIVHARACHLPTLLFFFSNGVVQAISFPKSSATGLAGGGAFLSKSNATGLTGGGALFVVLGRSARYTFKARVASRSGLRLFVISLKALLRELVAECRSDAVCHDSPVFTGGRPTGGAGVSPPLERSLSPNNFESDTEKSEAC